jgi:hypothetical protein
LASSLKSWFESNGWYFHPFKTTKDESKNLINDLHVLAHVMQPDAACHSGWAQNNTNTIKLICAPELMDLASYWAAHYDPVEAEPSIQVLSPTRGEYAACSDGTGRYRTRFERCPGKPG